MARGIAAMPSRPAHIFHDSGYRDVALDVWPLLLAEVVVVDEVLLPLPPPLLDVVVELVVVAVATVAAA